MVQVGCRSIWCSWRYWQIGIHSRVFLNRRERSTGAALLRKGGDSEQVVQLVHSKGLSNGARRRLSLMCSTCSWNSARDTPLEFEVSGTSTGGIGGGSAILSTALRRARALVTIGLRTGLCKISGSGSMVPLDIRSLRSLARKLSG